MESLHQPDDHPAQYRLAQSSFAGGSLAEKGPEHGSIMAGAFPLRPKSVSQPSHQTSAHMECSGQNHDHDAAGASASATDTHRMAALGVGSGAGSAPMAGEISSGQRNSPSSRRSRKASVSDGSVNPDAIWRLLERQQFRCTLTGRALSPETASLDHIIPVCRGGEHAIGNTQVLDRIVNRAKGTLTNEEFITLCGEVWKHAQGLAHQVVACVQN